MIDLDGESELHSRNVQNAKFFYRGSSVDEIVLDDAYQQLRFTAPALADPTPPLIIVDAGAHIGAFAILVALSRPAATVYALEPAHSSFALLERNIEANNLTNVVAERIALGSSDTYATLFHAPDNWGHSLHPQVAADGDTEKVMCCTLETFMTTRGLRAIDIMKMNIEGGEYDVLLAASCDGLRRVRSMTVEVHPVAGHSGDEIIRKLKACGFEVNVWWSPVEVGKGWIQAVSSPEPRLGIHQVNVA